MIIRGMSGFNLTKTATLLGASTLLILSFQNCSSGLSSSGSSSLTSASMTDPQQPSQQPASQSPPQSTLSSYTGWPLSFIETDLATAYPNILYYSRVAVIGGLYPYTFTLLKAPIGMQIQNRTGELKWTPSQNNTSATVEVQVTDAAGATLTHSYPINVTTNGFYFIDANSGGDSNSGAITAPFKTLAGVQAKALPMTATLYFKTGTYVATGINMNEMPGLWMAYPGIATPVLDCQGKKNCIGLSGLIKYPALFQGLNFTNVEYEYFGVDGDTYPITWRNNIMNGLVVTSATDSAGNPAFIFMVGNGGTLAETSEPPPVYQHVVIQNNQFYDLEDSFAARASPYVFYNVSHSVVEDNIAHDVQGTCGEDKQNGWFNTLRHNVCYHIKAFGIDLLADLTLGQDEIDHNLFIGVAGYSANAVQLGYEPGFIQDVYVHNNTFVNGSIAFGSEVTGANSKNLVIKNNIFYDDGTGVLQSFYGIGGTLSPSALPTSAIVNDNIYWGPPQLQFVISSYQTVRTTLTTWLSYGFDSNSLFTQPALSPGGTDTSSDYSLSPSDPHYGVYGKDFSAGVWQ